MLLLRWKAFNFPPCVQNTAYSSGLCLTLHWVSYHLSILASNLKHAGSMVMIRSFKSFQWDGRTAGHIPFSGLYCAFPSKLLYHAKGALDHQKSPPLPLLIHMPRTSTQSMFNTQVMIEKCNTQTNYLTGPVGNIGITVYRIISSRLVRISSHFIPQILCITH